MSDAQTILLVDDEDSVQKLLAYPLERDGYEVLPARDGEEALISFAQEQVDLVVLDLMLPRLDGLEVCRQLRAQSSVPIIMLTARGDEERQRDEQPRPAVHPGADGPFQRAGARPPALRSGGCRRHPWL